jgi:hypothetical protein
MSESLSKILLFAGAVVATVLPAKLAGAERQLEELSEFGVKDYATFEVLENEDSRCVSYRHLDSKPDIDATVCVAPEEDNLFQYLGIFVGRPGEERKSILDFDGDQVNDGNALLRGKFSMQAFDYEGLDSSERTYHGEDVDQTMLYDDYPSAEENTTQCESFESLNQDSSEALEVCLTTSSISNNRGDIIGGSISYSGDEGRLMQKSFFEGSGVTRTVVMADYVGGSTELQEITEWHYTLMSDD